MAIVNCRTGGGVSTGLNRSANMNAAAVTIAPETSPMTIFARLRRAPVAPTAASDATARFRDELVGSLIASSISTRASAMS